MTYMVTDYGKPFNVNGLGNKMRDWCDEAGLPHCSTHGLRKAGATMAAENGATDDELMAIFGWTTKQQTTLYTKSANRKKLVGGAMHKLSKEQRGTDFVPHPEGVVKSGTKSDELSNVINVEKMEWCPKEKQPAATAGRAVPYQSQGDGGRRDFDGSNSAAYRGQTVQAAPLSR